MADLTIAATITRAELGLADLSLNDGAAYVLAGRVLDIGRMQRRRQTVTGPFVRGGIEVASQEDMATLRVPVEVMGSTFANVMTRMNTLVTAFSQDSYTVTFTIDGVVFNYDCYAADYETGLTTERMVARRTILVFDCPRQPGTEVT